PGAPHRVRDRVRRQLLALGVIERAPIGLPDRRACGGDDNGFPHGSSSISFSVVARCRAAEPVAEACPARNLAAAGDLRPPFGRVRRCATVLRVMTARDRDPVLGRRVTDAGVRIVRVGQGNRVASQAPISAPARLAPVGARSRMGPPKWVPATRVWVLSVAPSASHMALASSGKHAWSPVSSTNTLGAVTPDAQRRKSALVLS